MWQQVNFALRDSLHRGLGKVVSFLPAVIALLVAVLLFIAIGMALSFILRRILTAAKFDERFARTQTATLADWSPAHSPTALVGRVAFWSCVVLGLIVGISSADAFFAGNSQISYILIPYLTHSVGAVLLLVAGNIIARFLARSVLIGAVNHQLQYARFLSLGVKWLVLVLTAAMTLEHLQIGGTIVALAFGILFGGIVLTLALAIGLGSRDLVTRSLERTVEPAAERAPSPRPAPYADAIPPPATPSRSAESLRHF